MLEHVAVVLICCGADILLVFDVNLLFIVDGYASTKSSARALKECDAIILFYDGDRLIGQKMWSGSSKSGKGYQQQDPLCADRYAD